MNKQVKFSIRKAQEEDVPVINAYANNEGMDDIPGIENVYVAVNPNEELVGFIRLAYGENNIYHVNPVVVYQTWRGYGVGRALMEAMHKQFGELRFVSRGASKAFYIALGCEEIPWSMVDKAVVDDCDGCEMRNECNPVPMRYK